MIKTGTAIRLFVEQDLAAGHDVSLSPSQAHYVANVMRRGVGDIVSLFNGRDGEWAGRIQPGWTDSRLETRKDGGVGGPCDGRPPTRLSLRR